MSLTFKHFLYRKYDELKLQAAAVRAGHKQEKFSPLLATSAGFFPGFEVDLDQRIKLISYNDLHQYSADPPESQILGKGTFGTCVTKQYAHFTVCAKILHPKFGDSYIHHEANMLSKCVHPNIPYLFGVCMHPKEKSIIMSYHGTTTMHTLLDAAETDVDKDSSIPHVQWLNILSGVAHALGYLHSKKIVHNDVKSNNVVVEHKIEGFHAVLVDFGKSCFEKRGRKYKLSTNQIIEHATKYPHIAPDLRNGSVRENDATDVYSFGKLFETMINLKLPLLLQNRKASDLLDLCLRPLSKDRPLMSQIITYLVKLKEDVV